MEKLYIIDNSKPYDGIVLSTMSKVEKDLIDSNIVDYTKDTFFTYNAKHNNNLIVLDWSELEPIHLDWINSLVEPLTEITRERYFDLFECVPPKKWHKISDKIEVFFVGECFCHNLYRLCARIKKNGKYKHYSAIKPIQLSDADILKEIASLK